MHPALIFLLKLRVRAALRTLIRNLKTPRKAFFIGIAFLWFAFTFGPMLLTSKGGSRSPELFRTLVPMFLFCGCLISFFTSAGDKVIQFQPHEIDILFAAPFSRRNLLTYKLITNSTGTLFTTIIFSIFFYPMTTSWSMTFLGLFLSLTFLQLCTLTFVLIRQTVTEHFYTPLRKSVLSVLGIVVLIGIWQAFPKKIHWPSIPEFRHFLESNPMSTLLAPFKIFAFTITAKTWYPDFLFWGSLSLLFNLVLFAVVLRLDANYLETSMNVSHKIYQRLQRVRSGGSVLDLSKSLTRRWGIPVLPWLGGAGPILWRQLLTLLRNAQMFLFLLVIMAFAMGPAIISMGGKEKGLIYVVFGLLAWITFVFAASMRFDFRGDLDHLPWLKMLPIHPLAITLGEMSGAVLILTGIHIIALFSFSFLIGSLGSIFWTAIFCSIPFNVLLIGVQNLVFLLFPTRLVAATPGDLQQFGRQMAIFFLTFILVIACIGVSAGLGWLSYWFFNNSQTAFSLVFTFFLYLTSIMIVPFVVWAFERFDVSLDTPA